MKVVRAAMVIFIFPLLVVPLVFGQGKGKGENNKKAQYDFCMTFNGDYSLLPFGPWEGRSPTGGHGNIGPFREPVVLTIQLDSPYRERLAELGDADCPCPETFPCGGCANRLAQQSDLAAYDIAIRPQLMDPYGDPNVLLGFKFQADDGGVLYTYGIQVWGLTEPLLAIDDWDPANGPDDSVEGSFAQHIIFSHTGTTQLDPFLRKKDRGNCDRGATCESRSEQFDDPDIPRGGFEMKIWRKQTGENEPCGPYPG